MDQGRRREGFGGSKDEYNGDSPVYSRLFVVCEKGLTENDFRTAFSSYGEIEDIRMPCDSSGKPKGVAYIKFAKTSGAALALEGMNLKTLPKTNRPLKVMVAANRSEVASDDFEKYRRLFVTVPRSVTENDLDQEFNVFGHIQTIILQKDHDTGLSKGFAYITYAKFSQAAKAFEECDKKYRAVFAKPKAQRRQETVFESNINDIANSFNSPQSLIPMLDARVPRNAYSSVNFMCCPNFNQGHMERLFDLVPGMVSCNYFVDLVRNVGKGTAYYSNPKSAAYAVEKLNEFEYPPGMLIFVKPDTENFGRRPEFQSIEYNKVPNVLSNLRNAIQSSSGTPDLAQLAEAIAEASKLIKKATGSESGYNSESKDLNYCSIKLPPPQPLADIDSAVAKRCFLICKPSPPPLSVLRDVFCRFGDLINVYTLPNKTVGYARYATSNAADDAIKNLHGAEICGVRMKVMEADEEAPPRKRERTDF